MSSQEVDDGLASDELSLESFSEHVWERLEASPGQPEHPFRIAALATRGLDESPRLRSVVLRTVQRASWTLSCYSDRRSPKIAELRRDPRCTWLLYDSAAQLQVRIEGRCELHHDDALAESAWQGASIYARGSYLGPLSPSAPLPPDMEPARAVVVGLPPDAGAAGRVNFVVIRCRAQAFDCLLLRRAGHRRMRMDGGPEAQQLRWLAP